MDLSRRLGPFFPAQQHFPVAEGNIAAFLALYQATADNSMKQKKCPFDLRYGDGSGGDAMDSAGLYLKEVLKNYYIDMRPGKN